VNSIVKDTKIQVRQTGATWGVFVDGELHEGGFFSRLAAQRCKSALEEERIIAIDELMRGAK
jgi:hypothetical protein